MPIFIILIILSLSFYTYFKITYYRTKDSMYKKLISAKSSIALGSFIVFFALNQLAVEPTKITVIIGVIFLLVGGGSIWAGIRAYRYYFHKVMEDSNSN